MKTTRSLSLLALGLAACASTINAPASRSYERANARKLPLRTIDIVVTSAPVGTSGPVLNVPTFDPPTTDGVVRPKKEDAATRDALVSALRDRLARDGFVVSFLDGGAIAPSVAPIPMPSTSTAVVTSSIALSSPRFLEAPPTDRRLLQPGTTLASVLSASRADAVLVVRVVPVDAFYVFVQGETQAVVEPDGTTRRATPQKPLLRSGRLLLGQAFLFDRETGLRLWSRQLPDFPNGGALALDDPFLGYGVVTDPAREPELPVADRALRSAARFVGKMFDGFMPPSEGDASARTALASVDVAADVERETELDRSLLGLGLDLAYQGETAGAKLELDANDDALADLGTGALAPNGIVRIAPSLLYRAPGGLALGLSVPVGRAPGSFARAYHLDGATPRTDSLNRTAKVSIDSVTTIGVEAKVGYALVLSSALQIVPSGGAFFELWALDAGPSSIVPDTTHARFGILGSADILYTPESLGSLYFKAAPVLRLGIDHAGPAVIGGGLTLGVGVFL